MREQLAVAEQALWEPATHGSMTDVDSMLDGMLERLIMAHPTVETWGATPTAMKGQAAAEALFGEAKRRTAEPPSGPSTISPDEPAA